VEVDEDEAEEDQVSSDPDRPHDMGVERTDQVSPSTLGVLLSKTAHLPFQTHIATRCDLNNNMRKHISHSLCTIAYAENLTLRKPFFSFQDVLESGGCVWRDEVRVNGAVWHPRVLPYGQVSCVACYCKVTIDQIYFVQFA